MEQYWPTEAMNLVEAREREAVRTYPSTRGETPPRSFSEILIEGLAPDGGLYLPERYPRLNQAELRS